MTLRRSRTVFDDIREGNLDAVMNFLAKPDAKYWFTQQELNAVVRTAIRNDDFEMVQLFLTLFRVIDRVDALEFAATHAKVDMTEFLLDNYFIYDKTRAFDSVCQAVSKPKNTALVVQQYFDIMKLLYRAGCHVDDFHPIDIQTKHDAVTQCQISAINHYFMFEIHSLQHMATKIFATHYCHKPSIIVSTGGVNLRLESWMLPADVVAKIQYFALPLRVNID